MEDSKRPRKVTDIFAGTPKDHFQTPVESPPVRVSDFDDEPVAVPEPDPSTNSEPEPAAPSPAPEPAPSAESSPEEDVLEPDVEELTDEEIEEEAARKAHEQRQSEMRARMVKLMKPSRIIALIDMLISAAGAWIAKRSEPRDWRFQKEQKKWLADCMDLWIDEDGIHLMPIRYWLIFGFFFFIGLNAMNVRMKYYSKAAMQSPDQKVKDFQEQHTQKLAEYQIMEMEAEQAEKEADLAERIQTAKDAKEKGMSVSNYRKWKVMQDKEEAKWSERDNHTPEELLLKYPPERFMYIDGQLQWTKQGHPRRKPGQKNTGTREFRHPVTQEFMSKSAYYRLRKKQPEIFDDYTPPKDEHPDQDDVAEETNTNGRGDIQDVDFEEVAA